MAKVNVTAARRQERLRPDGGTTTVYVVWLETSKGATGSVDVPVDVWEDGDLKAYLVAEGEKLDKAFTLDL